MKRNFTFLSIILLLNVVLSCSKDPILDQITPETNLDFVTEQNDSIQSLVYCYGCLPMVTAFYDPIFDNIVIAWSGFREDETNHPITISYKIDQTSGKESIGRRENGEIRKKIYSESCTSTWSINCSYCSSCKNSGSIYKKSSGQTETGSETECFKKYLDYSIEKITNSSNSFYLVLNDWNNNLQNTEKYMPINNVRFYTKNSYGFDREIYSAGSLDTSEGPHRLKLYLSYQEMHKDFKVVFYNSKCEYNQKHYLYANYRFSNFGAEISEYSPRLINLH